MYSLFLSIPFLSASTSNHLLCCPPLPSSARQPSSISVYKVGRVVHLSSRDPGVIDLALLWSSVPRFAFSPLCYSDVEDIKGDSVYSCFETKEEDRLRGRGNCAFVGGYTTKERRRNVQHQEKRKGKNASTVEGASPFLKREKKGNKPKRRVLLGCTYVRLLPLGSDTTCVLVSMSVCSRV